MTDTIELRADAPQYEDYFVVENEHKPGQFETYRVTAYSEQRTWGRRICDGTEHHFANGQILAFFDSLMLAEEGRERADAAWAATASIVEEARQKLMAAQVELRTACRRAAQGLPARPPVVLGVDRGADHKSVGLTCCDRALARVFGLGRRHDGEAG